MPPKPKSRAAAAAPAAGSPRKTRSMTAGGRRGAEPQPAPAKAAPVKKEEAAAATGRKGRKRAHKKEETAKAAEEPKGRKKAKKEEADSEAAAENGDGSCAAAGDGKRVIVEACTQCRHFKIRAQKVKEDLESSVPGVSVIINPEKPRRGCLEIREEGGEVFISLLNMPRPFTAMKKLDMDEVIKDIAKKIVS